MSYVPPSLQQMDGVGPAEVGGYVLGEPFTFVDSGVVLQSFFEFPGLLVDQTPPGTDPPPGLPPTASAPNTMVVYAGNRVMVAYR